MEMNKKIYSAGLASVAVILFLISISSTASASITETRISTSGGVTGLDIYNDRIVWTDLNNHCYIYDLSTSKKKQINTSEPVHGPSIYNNKIVFEAWHSGLNNVEIHMYDLSTKKETTITTSGVAYNPRIYGNRILWEDDRTGAAWSGGTMTGNYGIYMYDLSTKKETKISTRETARDPDIYGDKIVWNDNRSGKHDIYMYDLSTKKETQITSSGRTANPSIYKNRILWLDYRHDNSSSGWYYPDIYMYDLTTHKETRITTYKSWKSAPGIYGNSIAWYDERNIGSGGRIYLYDLSTHQQIHATKGNGHPVIYGNKIVWVDNRNDNDGDVYMGAISYLPVAAFTASPTSGKHPLTVKFTDKSTDGYYWFWNFGDKSTSTLKSPVHKYTKAGKYTVALKVKNAAGSNTKTMSIKVK
jgi:beta propeller repeat protein